MYGICVVSRPHDRDAATNPIEKSPHEHFSILSSVRVVICMDNVFLR